MSRDDLFPHTSTSDAANYQPLTPLTVPRARRRRLPGAHRRHPRGAALHLRRVLRARPAAGLGAGGARHRPGRHRLGDARQHAADAGGALRRADDRRRAARDQHAPRCRASSPSSSTTPTRKVRDLRPRVRARHARGARAGQGAAARHRLRRHRVPASGRAAVRHRLRGASSPSGDPGFRLAHAATTSGRPSRSTTPRAPPATPRASSTTTAAPHSCATPTCSRPAWASTPSICGRCRCSTATAGAFPGRCRWSPARTCACAGCGPRPMFDAIAEHKVTHLCGAPDRHVDAAQCHRRTRSARCRTRWSSSPPPRRRRRPCSRPWPRPGSTSRTSMG